ncbi:MAG: amino acid adenylation domain-containing protein [bacterium]|nr:amino acid adenylation domain-containing protein [bacterium]
MSEAIFSRDAAAAAGEYLKENVYWMEKLSGEIEKATFPYDREKSGSDTGSQREMFTTEFRFPVDLYNKLTKLCKGADSKLHMVLSAGLTLLLSKYCARTDIIIGTTIRRQETDGDFINTVLPLRSVFERETTFKELLIQMRTTIKEAGQHQNYPMEVLLYQLKMEADDTGFPLFDVALMLENIHEPKYMGHINPNVIITVKSEADHMVGRFICNTQLYKEGAAEVFSGRYLSLLEHAVSNPAGRVMDFDLLTFEEKERLLKGFNGTDRDYPSEKTVIDLFEAQVERSPNAIALAGPAVTIGEKRHEPLTFKQLNEKANRLAGVLRKKGTGRGTIVAVLMETSPDVIVGVLAILKAGGGWLPIDAELPTNRIQAILKDSGAHLILTQEDSDDVRAHRTTLLQDLRYAEAPVTLTAPRAPIQDFDSLLIPDRSLLDFEKYYDYIGHAMVKNSFTLQATRGCPYNCAYCHKIWPKAHVVRSAENIYNEVKLYYDMGVTRFAFIDDIFNLDKKNSSLFFRKIIDNGLDVQFFFPAGLRGDILTPEYIDLMVEAGTTSVALALETASPRVQKVICKNLNIENLRKSAEYFSSKYPHVILELFSMHGFPTETEEEARLTLDFIKSIKWFHFPYINILKIYPNTDMERLAMANGITEEQIMESEERAHHELPETLPFPKAFTLEYQTEFLNEYFLNKERLLHVLPYQMDVLTEEELAQKYNSYVPAGIETLDDILELAGISREEFGDHSFFHKDVDRVPDLNAKIANAFPKPPPAPDALRLLLLDLSQSFSGEGHRLNDLVEPPLGLMYLTTHLQQHLGDKVNVKVLKSLIDFSNYGELKELIADFNPDVIGIRTLIFYKEAFHRAASLIRHWGFDKPLIAGGPYASSSYKTILQDGNIDLIVMGEGEITFTELMGRFLDYDGKMPPEAVLRDIAGLAYLRNGKESLTSHSRELVLMDRVDDLLTAESPENPGMEREAGDLLYTIYTSGSTGTPKGVLLQNRNLVNYVSWFSDIAGLQVGDKSMLISSFAFDLGYTSVFTALTSGCELHIVPADVYLDPDSLPAYMETHGITYIKSTPTLFSIIAGHPDFPGKLFDSLRLVVLGGEEINLGDVQKIYEANPDVAVMNHYGPTEATIGSVARFIDFQTFEDYRINPTIGKPIHNARVYLLDAHGAPVPPETAGELCLAGDCLARGYLNRPQLTAERFIDFPLVEADADDGSKIERVYRTGDLAKWMPDGNILFLGRLDHQVKVRGFRIEPGEIENRILQRDDVKDVVVHPKTDSDGDKYLCAYIVFEEGKKAEGSELREYLASRLPEYMLPGFFVSMEKIPMTANGKVNRKLLPDPERGGGVVVQPVTGTQETLTDIWADLLKVETDKVGIRSSFFEMGGHSLKAVMLISRIHKELEVKIPLAEIFKGPTIEEMGVFIDNSVKESFTAIEAVEKREYYPLSSAQKRIYILYRLEPDSIWYNTPKTMMLEGEVDVDRMGETFRQMMMRHESLRTSFHVLDGMPVQRVHDAPPFNLEYTRITDVDGAALAGTAGPDIAGDPLSQQMPGLTRMVNSFVRPFDLSEAPTIRVGIIEVEKSQNILMMDIHHIVSDGTSLGIFVNEFMTLYGGHQLPPLKIQYKDYAQWQHRHAEESYGKQEAYWLEEFKGEIPVINLPTDFPRPAVRNVEGNTVGFMLDQTETTAVRDLAQKEEATLYLFLLATFNILMAKLCGQEDIVVGTPLMGRRHADLEPIIGMFIDTLAMRNYPQSDKTFRDFLREVRERTFEQFENQDYPFDELVANVAVERDNSRNPLFDVMFVLQNVEIPKVELPGMKLQPFADESGIAKFDLSFVGTEMDDRTLLAIEYSTQLFKRETIERYGVFFKRILEVAVKNPDTKLADIVLLSTAEKETLLRDFCLVPGEGPQPRTIHQLFEERVESYAGNRALVKVLEGIAPGMSPKLTYAELDEQVNALAGRLRRKGVTVGTVVPIMVEPSFEMFIGIFAVLKAGGAYLPLEPSYPAERIDFILADCDAGMVLTTGDVSGKARAAGLEILCIETPVDGKGYRGEPSEDNVEPETKGAGAADLAYIIYTSGSTGRPKGVAIRHHSVVNLMLATEKAYPCGESGIYLRKTAFIFDVMVLEIFCWFTGGGGVAVMDTEGARDPHLVLEALQSHKVTHVNFVPALFNRLVDMITPEFIAGLSQLSYIFLGGETASPEAVRNFLRLNTGTLMFNSYGPTEATVYASRYPVSTWNGEGSVPIGRPITNTGMYILDESTRLQPVGIPGELAIGGSGVAAGYLNKPELTAESFIANPFEKAVAGISTTQYITGLGEVPLPGDYGTAKQRQLCAGSLLYKTGDLARWLPDGNIEFMGRLDRQVKVRGYRIELEEIEHRLTANDAVKEVAVLVREEKGDSVLCAYIVADAGLVPDAEALREYLGEFLPEYMVPGHFVQVPRMPLTAGGKIDRRALLHAMPANMEKQTNYIAPGDETEGRLVDIWAEVLDVPGEEIGIDADFFRMGGHSLKATLMVTKLHKAFNVKVPLKEVFTNRSIRNLAGYIKTAVEDTFKAVEPVEKRDYYPLSSQQKRLMVLQQMDPGGTVYNMPQAMPLAGMDTGKLEQAFKKLIQRHESLRTDFHMVEGEGVQKVHPEVDFALPVLGEEQVAGFVRPFDLSRAPLLRAAVVEAKDGRYDQERMLLVDVHHIVNDGLSQQLLTADFVRFYSEETLPPLRLQYKDFAVWQSGGDHGVTDSRAKREQYWLERFSGDIPVLELPYDFLRPALQSFEGHTVSFEMESREVSALRQIAGATNTTMFMVLFSFLNILAAKLSGQEEIVLGTPVAGRRHEDLMAIIGMFVNTLALRNTPSEKKSFLDFLDEVRLSSLEAFENQDYPFEDLVEKVSVNRDIGRNPLFDVMFSMQTMGNAQGGGISSQRGDTPDPRGDIPGPRGGKPSPRGGKPSPRGGDRQVSKFDLTVSAVEVPDGIFLSFQYCTKLFRQETILRFMECFQRIVSQVLAAPSVSIGDIGIISDKEKERILHEFNGPLEAVSGTIHGLFRDQLQRTPENRALTAVEFAEEHDAREGEGKSLTYSEFADLTNAGARLLRERGVGAGMIVAVIMEVSLEMIISIYAILEVGAAYLPIEPDSPHHRIRYMLEDSGARMVFTTKEAAAGLPLEDRELIFRATRQEGTSTQEGIAVRAESSHLRSELPETSGVAGDPAYIIYTSGSTGNPKGVVVEHGSTVTMLRYVGREYFREETDVFLRKCTYIFDGSVSEMFGWFWGGGSLAVMDNAGAGDPRKIMEAVARYHVTHIHFIPSFFHRFVDLLTAESVAALDTLKYIFLGGEEVVPASVTAFRRFKSAAQLINGYGPSEAAVYSSHYYIRQWDGRGSVSIGRPLTNYNLFILDARGFMQPLGVPGELVVHGPGVARGYLNNPELTAARFSIPAPDRLPTAGSNELPVGGARRQSTWPPESNVYRTGDLARWLPDGNIEFLGRIDRQVQVRGFRIELGEIENRLLKYAGIKESVVVQGEDSAGDAYLAAYLTGPAPADGVLDEKRLRQFLLEFLPEYMVPDYFMVLAAFPQTPGGKIDRNALPQPTVQGGATYAAPTTETEATLLRLWLNVLATDIHEGEAAVGIDDNFFHVGGNSLKAMTLAALIRKELEVHVPLNQLFTSSTVRRMGQLIEAKAKTAFFAIPAADTSEHYPLSPAQRRLFLLQGKDPAGQAYNMPNTVPLPEEMDVTRLDAIFNQLIQRHESLRTSFHLESGHPVQVVHEEVEFRVARYGSEAEAGGFVAPFDLSQAPLMRVALLEVANGGRVLLMDMHHIITDGISQEILTREFGQLYAGVDLEPLVLQYKDYAVWLAREDQVEEMTRQENFWLTQFALLPPVLQLPADFPRPEPRSTQGAFIGFFLGEEKTAGLKEIAAETGATLFMVLLALFNIFLARLSGSEDIVVGTSTAGRGHENVRSVVGMFVKTLALRNYPVSGASFLSFLEELKGRTLDAFENQDYPFEELADRLSVPADLSRNPLFDVFFLLQESSQFGDMGNQIAEVSETELVHRREGTAKFDMTMTVAEMGGKLSFNLGYGRTLFTEATMEAFVGYFREIVAAVTVNREIDLGEIKISHRFVEVKRSKPDVDFDF